MRDVQKFEIRFSMIQENITCYANDYDERENRNGGAVSKFVNFENL